MLTDLKFAFNTAYCQASNHWKCQLWTFKQCVGEFLLLPPATKLGQGYVFTRVCDSVHKGHGIPACIAAGLWGGGIPACLAGLQAHTQGGSWGVWPGGVSRPTPRGVLQTHTRGGFSRCTLGGLQADPPPPGWLLLRTVRILLECILVLVAKRVDCHAGRQGVTCCSQKYKWGFHQVWATEYAN